MTMIAIDPLYPVAIIVGIVAILLGLVAIIRRLDALASAAKRENAPVIANLQSALTDAYAARDRWRKLYEGLAARFVHEAAETEEPASFVAVETKPDTPCDEARRAAMARLSEKVTTARASFRQEETPADAAGRAS